MIRDLDKYIIKLENFIPHILCDSIVDKIKKNKNWSQHQFYLADGSKKLTNKSGKQELDILYISDKENLTELTGYCTKAVKEYISYYALEHFSSIEAITLPRFNRYTKGKKMALHCDHIKSIFDGERQGVPILSILGSLNNDYVGGDFKMFDEKNIIDLHKGDILVFPSCFLYPHKVDPVKKGTRYSFISWGY